MGLLYECVKEPMNALLDADLVDGGEGAGRMLAVGARRSDEDPAERHRQPHRHSATHRYAAAQLGEAAVRR